MPFDSVKAILENGMAAWIAARGDADLSAHGSTFKWETKDELLAAVGKGRRLIQPELIGTPNTDKVNLIIDLKTGVGGRRMPDGGPYIPDEQIAEIEQWIKDGCVD